MNRLRLTAPALLLPLFWVGTLHSEEDAATSAAMIAMPGPASTAPETLAIRGATIHPVVGADVPDGTVLIEAGKISAVGVGLNVPAGARVVDASGLHLYPGFIDADTTLGLVEIPTVRGSVDLQETGRVNPDARAELAVNPASQLIGVARGGGVTTVLVVPDAELLGGTAALMDLSGWTWEEMLVQGGIAQHLVFPQMELAPPWIPQKDADDKKKEREKKLKQLDRIFDDAEAYLKAKQAAEANPELRPPDPEIRLEALAPVLRGEMPLLVTANELPAIKAAVEWAEKRKLKIILHRSPDAWRWASELAKRKIPVVLPDPLSLPARDDEPYDTPFTAAKVLYRRRCALLHRQQRRVRPGRQPAVSRGSGCRVRASGAGRAGVHHHRAGQDPGRRSTAGVHRAGQRREPDPDRRGPARDDHTRHVRVDPGPRGRPERQTRAAVRAVEVPTRGGQAWNSVRASSVMHISNAPAIRRCAPSSQASRASSG